jgi:hypothetical protein
MPRAGNVDFHRTAPEGQGGECKVLNVSPSVRPSVCPKHKPSLFVLCHAMAGEACDLCEALARSPCEASDLSRVMAGSLVRSPDVMPRPGRLSMRSILYNSI